MATTIQRMRETVQWTSGINIVAGLWLIIAPFVLGYEGIQAALWNDVLVGIIVAAFAVARVARPLMNPSLSWLNALLGLWLILRLRPSHEEPPASGPTIQSSTA